MIYHILSYFIYCISYITYYYIYCIIHHLFTDCATKSNAFGSTTKPSVAFCLCEPPAQGARQSAASSWLVEPKTIGMVAEPTAVGLVAHQFGEHGATYNIL